MQVLPPNSPGRLHSLVPLRSRAALRSRALRHSYKERRTSCK
jgi:hypothetical protein